MTVRLRASPFNITIIQVYAPTSSYDDSDVDEFYRELQSLVDQTPKQDILVVQGDWNAKVGEDTQEDWGEVCGPSCNPVTNDRDADLDSMVTHFNKAVTDTGAELLGKQRRKRKPWVTPEILDLCDQRRDLKKKRGEPEGAKDYREIKKRSGQR